MGSPAYTTQSPCFHLSQEQINLGYQVLALCLDSVLTLLCVHMRCLLFHSHGGQQDPQAMHNENTNLPPDPCFLCLICKAGVVVLVTSSDHYSNG